MNCRYHDEENGWCKLHSDWSTAMPVIEYCVEGPCPDESPITNRDSIRSMSAEEMVAFLMDFKDCSNCIIGRGKKTATRYVTAQSHWQTGSTAQRKEDSSDGKEYSTLQWL